MASNDEGQGSGDCDDAYRAADEFFSLTDDQQMLLLGPPVASGTETDTQTGAETETGAQTRNGIETGAETETGAASGSGAGVEPKAKRQRVPNKLRTTRLVVTEVDDGNFEPKAPEEARSCYGNQIGCIIPTSAASSNRTILLMMDSMSYTTCWSTDGITRTFACHLLLAMPIFCNGQRT